MTTTLVLLADYNYFYLLPTQGGFSELIASQLIISDSSLVTIISTSTEEGYVTIIYTVENVVQDIQREYEQNQLSLFGTD